MNDYILFTDGAYSSSRNQMGIGILFLKADTPILEYSKMFPRGTNNKAEIAAIIIALRMIKHSINSLIIVTDSEYYIGCDMKAKLKNTGEITQEKTERTKSSVMEQCASEVDWEQRRFDLIKAVLQGFSANENLNSCSFGTVATLAIEQADAVIEKLKSE